MLKHNIILIAFYNHIGTLLLLLVEPIHELAIGRRFVNRFYGVAIVLSFQEINVNHRIPRDLHHCIYPTDLIYHRIPLNGHGEYDFPCTERSDHAIRVISGCN